MTLRGDHSGAGPTENQPHDLMKVDLVRVDSDQCDERGGQQ